MATLLVVDSLRKAFGETKALRGCSFSCEPGSVHVLLGENGSGKSTAVKVLTGILQPDEGRITIDGRHVRVHTPRAARGYGVAAVLQEVLVVENRSVLQNVFLGYDGLFRRRLSQAERRRRASAVLERLSPGAVPRLDMAVENLTLAERQVVAIARALVQEPRLLILDEATSALDIGSRDVLLDEVERLAADGRSVIFISHRMDEVVRIGDVITVLRDGQSVASVRRDEVDIGSLLNLMHQGSSDDHSAHVSGETGHPATPGAPIAVARPVLRANSMRLTANTPSFDFAISAGEIVGVAGLEGHGQTEFLHALIGLQRPAQGIVVALAEDGAARTVKSLHGAARERIAYLPRDRKSQGIMPTCTILENFGLPTLGSSSLLGFVRRRVLRARFEQFKELLAIVARSPLDLITTLSGGNQQKVLLARWLALDPRVLVLDDPTRGVDVGTKRLLYPVFRELADRGRALVFLSTEIAELVELCDRVLVFRDKALFATLAGEELRGERVIAAMFGRVA